jgi:uncharacterized SAM-binding protein YcdF (DUF218 family)
VSTNGLPSADFIVTVNCAVKTSTSTVYAISAPDPHLANWAKIILHSHGVTEQQIVFTNLTTHATAAPANPNKSAEPPQEQFNTAFIVLGNRPLDDSTPTIDMIQRLLTAVPNVKSNPRSLLILTGGPTEGEISEAKMMALIALSRGVPRGQIVLEEESWTTGRNAANTAPIIARFGIPNIWVVSKPSHLKFAMPEFYKYPVFEHAQPLASPECTNESIAQMTAYLQRHPSPLVKNRLEALMKNSHGVD